MTRRNHGKHFLLVIPALIPLILIILLPALQTIYWSFRDVSYGIDMGFVGLDNYVRLFSDASLWKALYNTFLFTIIVVVGQITIGLLSALLLSRPFPFQKAIVSVVILPYAVTSVVAIIIWRYMLTTDVGIINHLLQHLGFKSINWSAVPLHAWIVVTAIHIWREFPFAFLIFYSAIRSIPKSLFEATAIDGASGFQVFRYLTFPLIKPALMLTSMFAVIFSFRSFDTVYILTRGGPLRSTELLSILLYRQGFSYWESGMASATAVILTISTLIFGFIYLRLYGNIE